MMEQAKGAEEGAAEMKCYGLTTSPFPPFHKNSQPLSSLPTSSNKRVRSERVKLNLARRRDGGKCFSFVCFSHYPTLIGNKLNSFSPG